MDLQAITDKSKLTLITRPIRGVMHTGIPTPNEIGTSMCEVRRPSNRVSFVDFCSGCASRYHHHCSCSSKNASTICSLLSCYAVGSLVAAGLQDTKVGIDSPSLPPSPIRTGTSFFHVSAALAWVRVLPFLWLDPRESPVAKCGLEKQMSTRKSQLPQQPQHIK